MSEERILLGHGGGGSLMQQLIDRELRSLYRDPTLVLHDAMRLELPPGPLAFSTDSYVVQPLEFAGGNIGELAAIGTANDLAMAGAQPLHLSVGLILEEGLELALLRRLLRGLRRACDACGLAVATGDTKVVERGKADGIYINTSGLGLCLSPEPIGPAAIRAGDQLLLSGDLGRHGVAVVAARHGLALEPAIPSDCQPLWPAVKALLAAGVELHCLRDLTRGGLASALQELAEAAQLDLRLEESCLPVAPAVQRCCELLGLEPLHLACEGRFVAVVPPQAVEPGAGGPGRVRLVTAYGSERLLPPASGELLPRIC